MMAAPLHILLGVSGGIAAIKVPELIRRLRDCGHEVEFIVMHIHDSMEAIVLLILSGRYIGHLPTKWAQGWQRRGLIRALMPKTLSYRSQFEVVLRTGTQRTNIIDAFMGELLAVYGGRGRAHPAAR